jgi:hypothetical protein
MPWFKKATQGGGTEFYKLIKLLGLFETSGCLRIAKGGQTDWSTENVITYCNYLVRIPIEVL